MTQLKNTILFFTAAAALAPSALAQQNTDPSAYYRAPSSIRGKMVVIPVGTVFEGRIDSSIGSSSSRQGQQFTITMSAPVLANGVDVLIPSGSQVLGEVVEAIPSSRLPRDKGTVKPTGKLRVQLSGLRTPDGISYPLVAAITGEAPSQRGYSQGGIQRGGVAYVGSSASFEAVAPGAQDRYNRQRGQPPRVLTRDELMRDPIYGQNQGGSYGQYSGYGGQRLAIRSLVKRNHELYIYRGSPLSIKLEAPFKIGFNPMQSAAPIAPPPPPVSSGSGKRFQRKRDDYQGDGQQAPPQGQGPPPQAGQAPGPGQPAPGGMPPVAPPSRPGSSEF